MRITVAVVAVGLVVLALLAFGLRPHDSPAAAAGRPSQQSLLEARVFVLMPDGRVEFTDAWARRVFRWDGRRWIQEDYRETLPHHPTR